MTVFRTAVLALALVLALGLGALVAGQSTVTFRTDIVNFVNGLRVARQTFNAMSGAGDALTVGHASATGVTVTADGGSLTVDGNATLDANGYRPTMPATQTIGAAGTVVADACGGFKRITAAGAVTTSTTNTFTAPAASNAGCSMAVCNVGATNSITLDNNANFKSIGGVDIILTAEDCTAVASDGTVWRSTGALVAN